MTREVPLTRGMVALVDDADYERVIRHRWHAVSSYGSFYAARQPRKAEGVDCRKRIWLHRLILDAPEGVLVDHANRATLDCRRENLRLATPSQNSANAVRPICAAGYRGVRYDKARGYFARIWWQNQVRNSKYVATAEEAARVYDDLALDLHGAFAVLNFPRKAA